MKVPAPDHPTIQIWKHWKDEVNQHSIVLLFLEEARTKKQISLYVSTEHSLSMHLDRIKHKFKKHKRLQFLTKKIFFSEFDETPISSTDIMHTFMNKYQKVFRMKLHVSHWMKKPPKEAADDSDDDDDEDEDSSSDDDSMNDDDDDDDPPTPLTPHSDDCTAEEMFEKFESPYDKPSNLTTMASVVDIEKKWRRYWEEYRTVKYTHGFRMFAKKKEKEGCKDRMKLRLEYDLRSIKSEWKKLSMQKQKIYEKRARRAIVRKLTEMDKIMETQAMTLSSGHARIFQCIWAACEFKYESKPELLKHVMQHHTSQIIMDSDQQYVCMYMTCLRNRKDGKLFPSLPRLHRHIKEKHMPVSARNVNSNQLCKNLFKVVQAPGDTAPRVVGGHGQQIHPQQQMQQYHDPQMQQHYQQPPQPHQSMGLPQQPMQTGVYREQGPSNPQQFYEVPHQQMHQGMTHPHHPHQQQMQQVVQQQIPDVRRTVVRAAIPAFVAPPNQIHSKRVLHSEAYLKYIESLSQNRQKSVSRWERSLVATHRNTQPSNETVRPPAHWITRIEAGVPVIREEYVTEALWNLRDELLKSTCGLVITRPPL
ncbi:hypothetical protein CRE_01180 [Caenorhabditis remanei]|uniref:C2H2-type domain-containing protein n=1 Tax=Caenorhabditis remanei TaxID=31234 RepID=E3MWF5_CAERE|nr:hypothetical protein CRE_01180 [Caenorhabditis remanei]